MPAREAEIVFRNGTVFDGFRFLPAGTSVRVRGSRIASVGPELSPDAPAVVDLRGGTLLPGFIDAHVHPVFAGDQLRRCDLSEARSLPEYLEIIAAYIRAHPGAEWITGGGWSMEAFPGGVPTAAMLDSLAPDQPVFLPNRDGHGAWVNGAALRLAGIDACTLDPADGRIERDHAGNPVGTLQEGATGLVSRLLPPVTEADRDQALLAGQEHLLSFGITGWQDAIVGHLHGSGDQLPAYVRAARDGRLLARVVGALWWDRDRGLEQLPELIERRGAAPEGRFRPTSVKMMLDGVAENHTAAMLEPYLDGCGCPTAGSGLDFIDPAELPRYVTALDRVGFQVHFHALGDRAVRSALDAIEVARWQNDGPGGSHHLAHLQVVHPDDIPRFADLSATANIQPLWAAHEPQMDELTIPFLGDRRAGWQYPFGSLLRSGAALCAGSDWPVSSPNPLWGAHVAVNRISPGAAAEPFLPEQRLKLTDILAAYTSGSARINGVADVTGALRAGMDADFAVVDTDLSRIPPHEIGLAAAVQTWIRGELVYDRANAPRLRKTQQGGKMSRRTRIPAVAAALAACALMTAACGRSLGAGASQGEVSPTKGLVTTTPPGTQPVSTVTWAVYRPVNSLDPMFAFDYPENTAISLMCESLLLQEPDGSIQPGLATVSTPTPTKMIFTLRPGVKFWNGDPVTPADVVYSLDRQMNPAYGGFYGEVFSRVKSIVATGASQVTITLSKPDYWLEGELSSMPGIIIQKSYAQQQAKNYGTPAGGIMCTGPYEFKSWTAGAGVTAVVNPHYWNPAVKPLVKQIVIKGVSSAASFTSGMLTGAIQGSYYSGLSNLSEFEHSSTVKVYQGPGEETDAFVVSATSGPLTSVKVRQALSLALDRQAIISQVYDGAALMPRWLANPGTFGYGQSVFVKAYDSSPVLTQNLAQARKLVREAGAAGQTITIGTSSEIASIAAETGAYQQAAEAIGLKVVLKSVSAANYINFFTSAQARAGIDGFITVNYGDYADPAALLATFALPGGDQNYDNFSNPQMTALLTEAEGTANPDQRAALVAKAEEMAIRLLPWIPDVQPTSVLFLSKGLTGAVPSFSFMFAPWADNLGGAK